MRRPLFAAALCLALALAVWQQASGPPAVPVLRDPAGRETVDGEVLTVTGRVIQKEIRSGAGSDNLSFILESDLSYDLICEPEDAADIPLGSRVRVRGTVAYFSQADNPGQFNMAGYYQSLGIGGSLRYARILARDEGCWRLREGLYRLRRFLGERLRRLFPEKEASVMATVLLGDKSALDGEMKALYKRNGIVHILSISGLHITILGMGLYRLLRRAGLPIAAAAVCAGAVMLLYGVMTGMGVSARRAIGMYLIRMLGEILGRTYDMLTALGVMAAVMLCGNPQYLQHSGFLLSFGSILAIGLVLPAAAGPGGDGKSRTGPAAPDSHAERLPAVIRKRLADMFFQLLQGIKQSFLAGLSITVFTLPIHFWFYFEFPVYSIFLNLLVLPLMGVVMTAGLAALLVPGLGGLSAAACAVLAFYERLCLLCEGLPGRMWTAGRPEMWQMLLYYALLAVFVCAGARWKMRRRLLWFAAMALLLGFRHSSGVTVAFLDVGQGDCIVVETGEEVYVFDGGSSSESRIGQYILIPYLKYRGISRIDAILVSHPDKDHVSGVEELLELGRESGVTVGQLVLPAIASGRRREEFAGLLAAAEGEGSGPGVKAVYIAAGEEWSSGGLRITCLHPPAGYGVSEPNAYSECFYARAGNCSVLLTGDVEGEGETLLLEELQARGISGVTVLKVAHHGSRGSTPARLLELVKPRLAVISCGRNNNYGHPHQELTERLENAGSIILQTPDAGAVTVELGRRAAVSSYHTPGR